MKKNISIFSVFVLSILALLTFCNSGVNSEDSKDAQDRKEIKPGELFISKHYKGLKSGRAGCGGPVLSKEYQPYRQRCLKYYVGESENVQLTPRVIVYVFIYEDNSTVRKHYIKEQIRRKNYRRYKGYSKYDGKDRIIAYGDGDKKNKVIYTEWISDNRWVKISGNHTGIPSELIQDYIAKYPPTVTFQSSDFDEEELIRDLMAKEYEGIMMLEGRRDSSRLFYKKTKELYAMINQCDNEMLIRCILGMADDKGKVECSTTYIIDDDKRARKWKELKSKIDNKDIVYDNVVWHSTNLKKLKCSHDKDYEYHKKMVNLLEMTREDLKNWPMFQNYVETEKEQ